MRHESLTKFYTVEGLSKGSIVYRLCIILNCPWVSMYKTCDKLSDQNIQNKLLLKKSRTFSLSPEGDVTNWKSGRESLYITNGRRESLCSLLAKDKWASTCTEYSYYEKRKQSEKSVYVTNFLPLKGTKVLKPHFLSE